MNSQAAPTHCTVYSLHQSGKCDIIYIEFITDMVKKKRETEALHVQANHVYVY